MTVSVDLSDADVVEALHERAVDHLRRRTIGNQTAFVQHPDAIGRSLRLFGAMGAGNNGKALFGKAFEQCKQAQLMAVIQARNRLIQYDQPGALHQRPSDQHQLSFAAGQFGVGAG